MSPSRARSRMSPTRIRATRCCPSSQHRKAPQGAGPLLGRHRGATFPVLDPRRVGLGALGGRTMTVATMGQKTVLVIEDDPWTRTITTALLAGEGFAVVEAKNGEEG